MILFLSDEETISKLEVVLPDWDKRGFFNVDTLEKLVRACEAAMMFLDEE